MSAIDTRTSARREAATNAAERRKKLLVVGLMVVFAAVLAFQLPKLLKGSDTSSSSAPAPAATTAATPAAADPTQLLASSSTAVSAKRVRAIRSMSPKDPFVPLIRQRTTSPSTSSTNPTTRARARVLPRPAAGGTIRPGAGGTITFSVPGTKPLPVRPLKPTAAVIWTNGHRVVVGVGQLFNIGDARFKLVGVNRKTMRVQVADGAFAGGKRTMALKKGRRVTFANTATGVKYVLRFGAPTTAASTVPTAAPATTAPAPAAPTTTSPAAPATTAGANKGNS